MNIQNEELELYLIWDMENQKFVFDFNKPKQSLKYYQVASMTGKLTTGYYSTSYLFDSHKLYPKKKTVIKKDDILNWNNSNLSSYYEISNIIWN